MKKIFLLLLSLLILPVIGAAHTSDERYVDGYVVDLSTAPVAPWVGEKVGMSFVFLDPHTFRATTTVVSATLSIDATFRANRKPQEVIYAADLPVENSGITTSYTFTEEGTYDMHLTFTDTQGKTHVAGFRKQVRDGNTGTSAPGVTAPLFFLTILVVGVLCFVAGKLWKKEPAA